MDIPAMLLEMHGVYTRDPVKAVRGQGFIKILHRRLSDDLTARLTPDSLKRKVAVMQEATIFGSHKPKDVDVSVIDPANGPLMMIGIRSQMSSVGKNVLTYYEQIIGECISLQDRFPMAVIGYIYLMPLRPIKAGLEHETVDHVRYSQFYDAITGREGPTYRDIRGVFDQFAYIVVDFATTPPVLRDDLLRPLLGHDLHISTFVDRMVATFKLRHLFLDVFT
ncbi:MAG: hypothetical protein HY535_00155 [Chloroflexi bacterium]|nr:hypothetical protein [Chloroflexota bacterium]